MGLAETPVFLEQFQENKEKSCEHRFTAQTNEQHSWEFAKTEVHLHKNHISITGFAVNVWFFDALLGSSCREQREGYVRRQRQHPHVGISMSQ